MYVDPHQLDVCDILQWLSSSLINYFYCISARTSSKVW